MLNLIIACTITASGCATGPQVSVVISPDQQEPQYQYVEPAYHPHYRRQPQYVMPDIPPRPVQYIPVLVQRPRVQQCDTVPNGRGGYHTRCY